MGFNLYKHSSRSCMLTGSCFTRRTWWQRTHQARVCTAATMLNINSFGAGNTALSSSSTQNNSNLLNSKFSDVKSGGKNTQLVAEIERTYDEFKLPMKEGLAEIMSYSPALLDGLEKETNELKIHVAKLKNVQSKLIKDVDNLRVIVREQLNDARTLGKRRMQYVRSKYTMHVAGGGHFNEEQINAFYNGELLKYESRLKACFDEITHLKEQLIPASNITDIMANNLRNIYTDNTTQIGPLQIKDFIYFQNNYFGKIATIIAQLHAGLEHIKSEYLSMVAANYQYQPNVFTEADKAEKLREKRQAERFKLSEQGADAGAQVQQSTIGAPASAASSNAFSSGQPAAPTNTFGLGAFGPPAPAGALTTMFGGFGASGGASSNLSALDLAPSGKTKKKL